MQIYRRFHYENIENALESVVYNAYFLNKTELRSLLVKKQSDNFSPSFAIKQSFPASFKILKPDS